MNHSPFPSRRQVLRCVGAGFGSLALTAMLAEEVAAGQASNPLAARRPHFPARAKRVIFLFMPGGPSQVDTFDPKPRLTQDHGKPSPKLYLGASVNIYVGQFAMAPLWSPESDLAYGGPHARWYPEARRPLPVTKRSKEEGKFVDAAAQKPISYCPSAILQAGARCLMTVREFSAAGLNKLNAESLLIGGIRKDNADGTTSLTVTSNSILVANDAADHCLDVALTQPIDGEGGHIGATDPGWIEFRPERHDQQPAHGPNLVHSPSERFEARRVDPLHILEDHQDLTRSC